MIKEIVDESKGTYGYRRVTIAMRNRGILINHKRVLRLMNQNGLLCNKYTRRSRGYSSFKGEVGKIADNKLNRDFKASSMYEKWVTDVTEFRIPGIDKKLYLSPIMDLYNKEIISYSLSIHPTVSFTNKALKLALNVLPKNHSLTIHSDQGFHYQHKSWIKELDNYVVIQSMSRRGNCLDNSPMENFFGILKQEMFYGVKFNSISELEREIRKYIYWYNNERIKANLNGMSPVEYRKHTA